MRQRGLATAATAIAATLAIGLAACGGDDEEPTTAATTDTTATGTTGATGEAGDGGTLTEQQFREFAENYSYDECEGNASFEEASSGEFSGDPEGKGVYYACGVTGGATYLEFEDEEAARVVAEEESETTPQLLVGNVKVDAQQPYVDKPIEFVEALSEECGCGEVIG